MTAVVSTIDARPDPPAGKQILHRRRSAESLALAAACRAFVRNAVRVWAIQPQLAWPLASIDRIVGLLPRRVHAKTRSVQLRNCAAELVCANGVSADRAVLYLHGGAFMTCGINTHRALVARLSKEADAAVLNVGYRMLPKYGLAEAIDDAVAGLRWLQSQGYASDQIVIAGDSAGGYLALATALQLSSRGETPCAGIAAISPLTDLDPDSKLAHRNAGRCAMFTGAALMAFAKYLQRCERRPASAREAAALVNPATADLSQLPPVTVHVSADESLFSDSELLADRLAEARVPCELHVWHGQVHDFPLAADVLPEGRRALRYVGDFVKQVTDSPMPAAKVS
ncbi:esterase [Mycobacterium sp. SWH-M5]|nr:esterase [Mycobacterium sp. SWH-M5]